MLPENWKIASKTLSGQYWSYEAGKRENLEMLNNTINTDDTEAG